MKTHVYKLVLGFMFTLLCITTQAQEYTYIPMVKPGLQIWTDDYWDCGGDYYYRRYALTEEDTLIESETYKKLYLFTDSVFNPVTAQCIGGLRENSQRQVFYKGIYIEGGSINSGLICDFSLSVGDTFASSVDFLTFKVISIDTILISNIKRREYSIGIAGDTITPYYVVGKWVEGIGCSQGLLYDITVNMTTCMYGGNNRCYEYNGELQYHYGDVNCFTPLMEINKVEETDNTMSIYPNPASESITISSDNIIKYLEIYNPLGQKVYQTKVNAKSKSIDINSLSKGIYIIGVNTDKGYVKKKIIVE